MIYLKFDGDLVSLKTGDIPSFPNTGWVVLSPENIKKMGEALMAHADRLAHEFWVKGVMQGDFSCGK